jgi:uncharacterized protein (DUF1697 family)
MTRLVALLRGINVGGHRVKMDELRRLFEALKLREVSTFIASGNVLFDAKATDHVKLEQQIEAHLLRMLGYAVPTLIRTLPELAAVADFPAFRPEDMADEGNSLNVLFLRSAPGADCVKALAALDGPKDEFRVQGREMYWLCRGKISVDSLAEPYLAKALKGCEGTMRNLRTVRQLAGLNSSVGGAPAARRTRSSQFRG